MATYFPDARVTGYEKLIGSMTNHPKDRHVLAAAVAGRADVLVTENLEDSPPGSVAHLEITVAGQDGFLSGLLELYPTLCWTRFAGKRRDTGASPGLSPRC
jgi:hypothetical protein